MAHGFWELDADGERIIGHAGSHFIFGSVLLLFPERRLGVFVASNSEGGNAFVGGGFDAFVGAFVERFFSRTRSAIAPSPDFASRASRFAGSYHLTIGRSERTPEKLLGLVMAANVAAGAEGLMVSLPAGRKRFIETEPLVFRQADGAARIVFREDGQGRIAQAFYGPIPITALVKSHWYETPGFNLPLLLGCLVAFVSFIPAGVIGLVRDRRAGRSEPWGRTTTAAGLLASVAGLLAAVGAAASIFDIVGLYTGHLPLWPVVVASSVTVTLCASGLAVLCVVVWKRSAWGVARRAHLVLVTVAAAAFVWFLAMWNLLARTF